MDYTEGNEASKTRRAKKMMLWFGIISLGMTFAGLTSAYVVSRERKDWLEDLQIPSMFVFSLVVIVLSSISIEMAKRSIQKTDRGAGMLFLWVTVGLGFSFLYLQYAAFSQIFNDIGYAFNENISFSFIYIIVLVHIAHVIVAILALFVVIYNHFKKRYDNGKTLGVELATTFWHFVDVLWIYLFLFFYFVR